MHINQLVISLFFTAFVYANAAMAEEIAPPTGTKEVKLESISVTTSSDKIADDNCPMHKGKKDYKEHHGEPCPYHGKDHQHQSHEKCEHDRRNE
jgi:hypothetical protein